MITRVKKENGDHIPDQFKRKKKQYVERKEEESSEEEEEEKGEKEEKKEKKEGSEKEEKEESEKEEKEEKKEKTILERSQEDSDKEEEEKEDSDKEEEREKMEREKKMTLFPDLSSPIQDCLDYFQTRLCQFAFFVYTILLFSQGLSKILSSRIPKMLVLSDS